MHMDAFFYGFLYESFYDDDAYMMYMKYVCMVI